MPNTETTDANSVDPSTTPDAAASANATDATTAANSSTAADANKPTSLADVVKAASAGQDEARPTESSPEEQGKPAEAVEGEAQADPEKATVEAEDQSKPPPFHEHPRWKEKIAEVEAMKSQVEDYNNIVGFMQSNDLSNQEVATGLQMMAALKNDPIKAREMFAPYIAYLDQVAGEKLPDDLAAKVTSGAVDEATAKELARARNAEAIANERLNRTGQKNEQQTIARNQQAMAAAASTWENQMKAKDPEYAKKEKWFTDRVKVLVAEQPPATPSEATALLSRAYTEVESQLRELAPRKKPVASVSGQPAASAKAQPKNLREAIRLAANR